MVRLVHQQKNLWRGDEDLVGELQVLRLYPVV